MLLFLLDLSVIPLAHMVGQCFVACSCCSRSLWQSNLRYLQLDLDFSWHFKQLKRMSASS